MPDSPPKSPPHQLPAKGLLGGIMLALFAWGLYLGIGAFQAAREQHTAAPLLRGLVVFGFTLLFLGFWGAMLFLRGQRTGAKR